MNLCPISVRLDEDYLEKMINILCNYLDYDNVDIIIDVIQKLSRDIVIENKT